ncbi:MAG TPA: hypothetical protein VFT32_08405, partial [Candidatus Eisenbacteria bacterium]|nr:hypothetical protein [Candidatus Eisenbacteria bacterium]
MIPYVPQPAGNLWLAAIFSIILGGGATVAFHFATPGIRRRFPRADTIAWVVFAILAFSVLIQTRAVDRMFGGYFSYKTPRERLQDHFADFERQVARDPEIRRALEGFPGVSEKLQDMGRRGIPRLDDSTLRRRARIMASLLPLLGDHACACVVRLAPPSE